MQKEAEKLVPYKIEAGAFTPDYFVRIPDEPKGVVRLLRNLRDLAS